MIRDVDVWCCALVMIKRYGEAAGIEAAKRAEEFEAMGERDGQRVWQRIASAIDELSTVKPGEPRN